MSGLKKPNKDGNRSRICISLLLAERQWMEAQAVAADITISDWFRLFLKRERDRVESPTPEKIKKQNPASQRESYLKEIESCGGPLLSAKRLGITRAQVREWAKDPLFVLDAELARCTWLEELQNQMADIGRGEKRGDTNAIGWILNAHHPAYGRAKRELVMSMLGPLLKKLSEFLMSELGHAHQDQVKKALSAFHVETQKKMTSLT